MLRWLSRTYEKGISTKSVRTLLKSPVFQTVYFSIVFLLGHSDSNLTSRTPRRCLVRASSFVAATRTCGESELEAQKLCARNTKLTADSNSL